MNPPVVPTASAAPPPGTQETEREVPLTPMAWLSQNLFYLLAIGAGVVWLYRTFGWSGLPSAALTILGIGFLIFIHELGHFLVAKWCDVHVLTFSIGFGPAVPGCSFRRGETTYKLSLLPLGGYVNMVGEGTEGDDNENYPRSFKNKTVGQRMAIISAGVIMNVLLAVFLFIFVIRTHGVDLTVATVGYVSPGSPAWEEGVRPGWSISQIGSNDRPSFEDLRTAVGLSGKGEQVPFVFQDPLTGKTVEKSLEPRRGAGNLNPVIGVVAASRLQLPPGKDRKNFPQPFEGGSPAATARPIELGPDDVVLKTTDPSNSDALKDLPHDRQQSTYDVVELGNRVRDLAGKPLQLSVLRKGETQPETLQVSEEGFAFGDILVGSTDPDLALSGKSYNPFRTSLLPIDPRTREGGWPDPFVLRQRLHRLLGRPVVILVRREGKPAGSEPTRLFIPPGYHRVLGARMQMGEVASVRTDSPAQKVGLKRRSVEDNQAGDVIKAVRLHLKNKLNEAPLLAVGRSRLDEKTVQAEPLDPVRLPSRLAEVARQHAGEKVVTLIVPRKDANHEETDHALAPIPWDESWEGVAEFPAGLSSPLSIPPLGIAYWCTSRVAEVDQESSPLRPGDVLYRMRLRGGKLGKSDDWGPWLELRTKQGKEELVDRWAAASEGMQGLRQPTVQFGVRRDGEDLKEPIEVTLQPDRSWPLEEHHLGLIFQPDTYRYRAETTGQALQFGVKETWRFITNLYLGLQRLVTGRVSTETLGGPIEIVSTTFTLANDDFYRLLLFLGVLSINLAVVNFLPIPLLDGGHMVFLVYEKLRGKPAPEAVRAGAAYLGVALLLSLMLYVGYLDVKRRILGW